MTVFELIEAMSEVNPLARIAIMAGSFEADHAEDIAAVATPSQVWVRGGRYDKDHKTLASPRVGWIAVTTPTVKNTRKLRPNLCP